MATVIDPVRRTTPAKADNNRYSQLNLQFPHRPGPFPRLQIKHQTRPPLKTDLRTDHKAAEEVTAGVTAGVTAEAVAHGVDEGVGVFLPINALLSCLIEAGVFLRH